MNRGIQNTLPFEIRTNDELDYTVSMLKNSPNYSTLSDAYRAYYQRLGARVKERRATAYDPAYIYMYSTLDECLDELSSQFKTRQTSDELTYAKQAWLNTVMKIVYAEKMCIPQAALQRVAERFGDIFKVDGGRDDLGRGCNTGLAGRCLLIESQLVSGEDNPFLQFVKQLLIDAVEQSFTDTIASIQYGESSMAARVRPVIMEKLGLAPNSDNLYRNNNQNLSAFLSDLATRYNPGKIYDECYQHLCDEFKRCIHDEDNEGMETLLSSLGFVAENTEALQIDGKWNIKRFEVFLPNKIVKLLINSYIVRKEELIEGFLVIEADKTRYSFTDSIKEKQQRAQREPRRNFNGLFSPPLTRSASTTTTTVPAPNGWGGGGLFSSQPTRTTTTNNINGYSSRSNGPNTGSTG